MEQRAPAIDWLRGVVMALMLIDHVREYFTLSQLISDPIDLAHTPPGIVVLRLFTHLCAPTFVMLAGVSAYLYSSKPGGERDAARFLLTRGLWLMFLELTVISFVWTFNPFYPVRYLQVIWAIGVSMCALALVVRWRPNMVGLIGVGIVAGHNLLDALPVSQSNFGRIVSALTFRRSMLEVGPAMRLRTSYPVLAWIGVMYCGFALGPLFKETPRDRQRMLLKLGLVSILLFVVLRATGAYGDSHAFTHGAFAEFSLFSFFNTTKYPPSLQFLLWNLGVALLLLSWAERYGHRLSKTMITVGQVPLFFYVIHIVAVHCLTLVWALVSGTPLAELDFRANFGGIPVLPAANAPTILVISGVLFWGLFPLCKKYREFKRSRSSQIWSYL